MEFITFLLLSMALTRGKDPQGLRKLLIIRNLEWNFQAKLRTAVTSHSMQTKRQTCFHTKISEQNSTRSKSWNKV